MELLPLPYFLKLACANQYSGRETQLVIIALCHGGGALPQTSDI